MLSNGQGGLDWAGLPLVCAHLGMDGNPAALIDRLVVIKCHRPDQQTDATPDNTTDNTEQDT